MSRFVSLLDGPFAAEWGPYLDGTAGPHQKRQGSRRATTSSRTPGAKNKGTVYRKPFEHPELHLCTCGLEQEKCVDCQAFICRAPGHQQHVCGSAW